MISRYNTYNETRIFNKCIYLIESINEESSFDKIKSIWDKIVTNIPKLSEDNRKKILRSFIISAIVVSPISSIIKMTTDKEHPYFLKKQWYYIFDD